MLCLYGHVATIGTVRGSIPAGMEIFRSPPDRRWVVPSIGSLSWGIKRPGRDVDNPFPFNT